MPVAVGAVADRLYMMFEERQDMPTGKPREVLTITAIPSFDGSERDGWVTRPLGRFDAAPSLRGDGRVLDCVGSNSDLFVLMHGLRDKADPLRVSLMVMRDREWREAALPNELIDLSKSLTIRRGNRVTMEARWWLFAVEQGVGIAVSPAPGELRAWIAKVQPGVKDVARTGQPTHPLPPGWAKWSPASSSLAALSGGTIERVFSDSERLLVGLSAAQQWQLFAVPLSTLSSSSSWRQIASIPAHGSWLGASTTGEASGRLTRPNAFILGSGGGPHGPDAMALGGGRVVTEISTSTGRLLSVLPVAPLNPVSAADYRLMGVMFLLVLGTVVIFLARPPGDSGEVTLPDGTALADPVHRLMAGGIDLLIGCVLGTGVWGQPLRTLAAAEWWGSSGSLTVLATILMILVLQGTLCEWLFGKTPGKLMIGCEVRRVAPVNSGSANSGVSEANSSFGARASDSVDEGPQIGLFNAAIRNAIKWVAPLVSLLGLLDLSRRHRGDQWSGTAVIENVEELNEEPNE
jgi:hypothetical protein